MRAIRVEVYKHGNDDCTNGGITSRYNEIYVPCPTGNEVFDDDNLPENMFIVGSVEVFGKEHYHLEPAMRPAAGMVGWMDGGNIAFTSDSRWRMATGVTWPLQVHDRAETKAQYTVLSN